LIYSLLQLNEFLKVKRINVCEHTGIVKTLLKLKNIRGSDMQLRNKMHSTLRIRTEDIVLYIKLNIRVLRSGS
jgi:hypothetical protein